MILGQNAKVETVIDVTVTSSSIKFTLEDILVWCKGPEMSEGRRYATKSRRRRFCSGFVTRIVDADVGVGIDDAWQQSPAAAVDGFPSGRPGTRHHGPENPTFVHQHIAFDAHSVGQYRPDFLIRRSSTAYSCSVGLNTGSTKPPATSE